MIDAYLRSGPDRIARIRKACRPQFADETARRYDAMFMLVERFEIRGGLTDARWATVQEAVNEPGTDDRNPYGVLQRVRDPTWLRRQLETIGRLWPRSPVEAAEERSADGEGNVQQPAKEGAEPSPPPIKQPLQPSIAVVHARSVLASAARLADHLLPVDPPWLEARRFFRFRLLGRPSYNNPELNPPRWMSPFGSWPRLRPDVELVGAHRLCLPVWDQLDPLADAWDAYRAKLVEWLQVVHREALAKTDMPILHRGQFRLHQSWPPEFLAKPYRKRFKRELGQPRLTLVPEQGLTAEFFSTLVALATDNLCAAFVGADILQVGQPRYVRRQRSTMLHVLLPTSTGLFQPGVTYPPRPRAEAAITVNAWFSPGLRGSSTIIACMPKGQVGRLVNVHQDLVRWLRDHPLTLDACAAYGDAVRIRHSVTTALQSLTQESVLSACTPTCPQFTSEQPPGT